MGILLYAVLIGVRDRPATVNVVKDVEIIGLSSSPRRERYLANTVGHIYLLTLIGTNTRRMAVTLRLDQVDPSVLDLDDVDGKAPLKSALSESHGRHRSP
jgi:hypothetical protein